MQHKKNLITLGKPSKKKKCLKLGHCPSRGKGQMSQLPLKVFVLLLKTDLHTLKHEIKQYKSRKVGNAQFSNFDLIFKFAIEFGNQFHLFFMGRPSLF